MRDRPMGTIVVWWKTNGATLGKSLRIGAIAMPPDPAFNRTVNSLVSLGADGNRDKSYGYSRR